MTGIDPQKRSWKEEQRALTARARQVRIHQAPRGGFKPGTLLEFSDRTLQVTETGALRRVQLTPRPSPESANSLTPDL